MKHYNLNQLWYNTLDLIMNQGDELDCRVGKTKEIMGFQAELTNPFNNILLGFQKRKFSLSYACAEMLWYLSGTAKIDMIKAYASQYEKFAEKGRAYGAYGNRWIENPGFVYENLIFFHPNGHDQIEAVIHLLKSKPNTRQAIMTCWDSGDLIHAIIGDHKDLPCTIALNFLIRENQLHLIVTMRSNDAWLGFPYDIFCFTTLQRIIANELKLNLGTYIHQAGSEHLYERNFEKVNEILEYYKKRSLDPYEQYTNKEDNKFSSQENIKAALQFEKEIRKTHLSYSNFEDIMKNRQYEMDNMFLDLVLGTATKWMQVSPHYFSNSLFAEWQKQNLRK